MPVRFEGRAPGWRPSWPQMLDIVERYCQEGETEAELAWLRAHPSDWLMVTRYMRKRAENHMAESRKALREMPTVDEHGRTLFSYLNAKRDMDRLNRKRLHWLARIDEQIEEARYLLGTHRLRPTEQQHVVEKLLIARQAMLTDLYDVDEPLRIVESLLVALTGEEFDPDVYRPEGA